MTYGKILQVIAAPPSWEAVYMAADKKTTIKFYMKTLNCFVLVELLNSNKQVTGAVIVGMLQDEANPGKLHFVDKLLGNPFLGYNFPGCFVDWHTEALHARNEKGNDLTAQPQAILQIVPAQPQTTAVFADARLKKLIILNLPLACWALVQTPGTPDTALVGMVQPYLEPGSPALEFVDKVDTFLGYNYPGCEVDWFKQFKKLVNDQLPNAFSDCSLKPGQTETNW